SSSRLHTRFSRDWSSDVCSSDLTEERVRALREAVSCGPQRVGVGVGAAVEPVAAADSVRLARRALALVDDGLVPQGEVVWSEREIGRASCRVRLVTEWGAVVWRE